MRINHNITALNTYRQLSINEQNQSKSMAKLSSGLRINSAADDAAGLAISEKMKGQMRGLDQASRNAQDGISLVQTAEGALNETTDILQRMRELSVQGSNDTSTDSDRQQMQKEVSQLKSEIDRISSTTQFNTKNLLDGSLQGASTAQGTILNSSALAGTATQGINISSLSLGSSTNIVTGINDQIQLNVDGAGAQSITIAQGQYDKNGLVAAINNAIGANTALGGKVTAQLTSNGNLSFVSSSTGTSSSVVVSAGTNDARATLGDTNAITAGVTTSIAVNTGITVNSSAANVNLKIGTDIKTVDLTQYGLTSITNNTTTQAALQKAFDDNFGKGAVTVGISGNSLTYTSSVGQADMVTGTAGANNITVGASSTTTTFSAGTATNGASTSGNTAQPTASSSTNLVALGDAQGNNLGLKVGNRINISVDVGGVQKSGYLDVTSATTTLSNLAQQIQTVIGGSSSVSIDNTGKLVITGQQGSAFEVSNLKLTAQNSSTDTTLVQGNFSNVLGAYSEQQSAKDTKLDGSLTFQIGANQGQSMKVDINEMSVKSLALSSIDVSTQAGASAATSVIDSAINAVSTERAKLGAFQNRLDHTINNLNTSNQNITDAQSRIADVDMAKEMMNQTKSSVLAQAAQAMLAQANQQPQQVLQLLRG